MESINHGTPENRRAVIVGPSAADWADGLIEAYVRSKVRLAHDADQLIRRLKIHQADLDGESAVDMAFFELWQTEAHNGARAFTNECAFIKMVWGAVRRLILQQRKRARSLKHGGEGRTRNTRNFGLSAGAENVRAVNHGFQRIEADLDQFVSRESPVEDVVEAKLDFQALLRLLDDDVLRAVLIMRDEGAHIAEIADVLDLTRDTVTRRTKKIARVYRENRTRP